MAVYVDYEFYTGEFGGSAIASANFTRLALLASALVDEVTFERAANVVEADSDASLIKKIQFAVCAVAEEIQAQEQNGEQVSSEKVGQYSVSYVVNSDMQRSKKQRQKDAAKLFLGNSGLMFSGFSSEEYGGVPD